jgi:signal transduction histidine kinase/ActR/RegA family two-component response regulator
MMSWIWDFLSTEGFQPHGMCLLWRADVFWAHAISDVVIALSYFSIPLAILYFAMHRPDIRYTWVLYLFGTFIVACGITHLFGIWTMWVPDYGVQAVLKLGTAAISATTAITLWPLMPRLLAVPSPALLEERNVQLALEVTERKAAEDRLAALNAELERRVAARTASLAEANQELRRARARAERSSGAKSEFLAVMSHEIRTPMNGVLGMLELLRLEGQTPEQARYTDIARDSAQGLLQVINDVLEYSRLEAGSVTLEAVPFSPAQVVDQVLALLGEGASEKGVALVADADRDLPGTLVGDPTRLRQILFNLVGNAIKFTEEGEVRIELRHESRDDGATALRVDVRDTGIGITAEAQERLFHRFSQAEASTMRKYGGSGLGLAITKQLVELMDGAVGVESAPGRGSRFWFTIRCRPAAEAQDCPARPDDAPVGERLRILVAEDNDVNQFLLARLLGSRGHSVEIVETGVAAVAALQRELFDIVFMDVTMPEMDGIAATREIRAMPGPAAAVPIVALTANAMASDRDACLAAGMDHYLPKPIVAETLFAAIARAMASEEMERPLDRTG